MAASERSARDGELEHAGAAERKTRSGGALAEWTLGLLGLLLFAGAILREVWPRLNSTVCRRTPADLSAIEGALIEHRALHGDWPDELDALIQPDERGHRLLDRTSLPRDAWGRAYRYDPGGGPERVPRIYTLGADGEVGGRGDDRDEDNWSLRADPR